MPTRQNSHDPAVGVPVPPPTDVAGVSATTVDCRAGGVFPNVAGCANVAAHWLTARTGSGAPVKEMYPLAPLEAVLEVAARPVTEAYPVAP
jgi:hypothetical protein